MQEKPRYGTWIRKSKIAMFWTMAAGFLALSSLGLISTPLYLIGILSLPFLYIAFILSLTAFRFGLRGGAWQDKIHELLRASIGAKGSVLDIGCGSGNLIIKVAKARLEGPVSFVGLDFWGEDWEYSKALCEANAEAEGIGGIEFVKGSASFLPFADASFENVLSCLTFHEVGDIADKARCAGEALRVLKPGGAFAFMDLFADGKFFGGLDHVQGIIEGAGGKIEKCAFLRAIEKLPYPLDSPKALGHGVLIAGKKG